MWHRKRYGRRLKWRSHTREIDLDVLENKGYSLALVFSSSKRGADFIGAVGSTLKIDHVRVICEREQQ